MYTSIDLYHGDDEQLSRTKTYFDELFKDNRYVHIIGLMQAWSQYGHEKGVYETYVNGYLKEEGSTVVIVDNIADRFRQLFESRLAGGNNVIVWRVTPAYAEFEDPMTERVVVKVRLRCHFMSMDELVNAIAKASV